MILDMVTRLPELTEVDGSMTPLEELDDSTKRDSKKVALGRFGCIWLLSITMTKGLYLYPGTNTSSTMLRLRVITSRNRITLAPSLPGVHVVVRHHDFPLNRLFHLPFSVSRMKRALFWVCRTPSPASRLPNRFK